MFAKRKARKIQVDEEEDGDENGAQGSSNTLTTNTKESSSNLRVNRKPFKKSALRQSLVLDDIVQDDATHTDSSGQQNESTIGSKQIIGRSGSIKKAKAPSSKLSFGAGEIISGDAAENLADADEFVPKKGSKGRRIFESTVVRDNLSYNGINSRISEMEDERPTYSKDYLNELKGSTPSTPRDLQSVSATFVEDTDLDASELEGALIVDVEPKSGPGASETTFIPSELEIKQKKERRARLAHGQDFISLDGNERDRRQLSLLSKKTKPDSRLVREDEDIAEGFDEFVDDGRISLGKKQEREAKRRRRKEMAELIQNAEGSSNEDSDDSDADRRVAYENAQTRAGMDGLTKPEDASLDTHGFPVPSKITALPNFSESLDRFQATLSTMEQELTQRQKHLAELKQEKKDIELREAEVQELLKQAGARYSALRLDNPSSNHSTQSLPETTKVSTDRFSNDRGLESFGNTPVAIKPVEDIG